MRADAVRNRELLLDAAVEIILELGAEPPLDAIARRADVGIGTLYRHFPDRDALINAVARHALERSNDAAEKALADAPDGFTALRRYMHAAVDLGVGVLNLIYPQITAPDWAEQRKQSGAALEGILDRGKQEGLIREDVRIPDIGFAVIRFSRPVASGLSIADEHAIAHRHLDIYINGLHSSAVASPLTAPAAMDQFEPGVRG